jgi:nucleoid DNA-binding protein
MNKTDLIDLIAEKVGISKADADRVIDTFVDGVADSLSKGDSVTIIGFGTFSINVRKARTGRNPRTGASIDIPERKVPKFKAGSKLKDKISGKA